MKENITTMLLLLAVLGIMYLTNMILGIVLGTKNEGFNWKKFWGGFGKAVLLAISFASFCFCIEVLPIILARIDISLPDDLVTLIEVVGITLTAYKKYSLDCIDKFKKIFNIE